LAAVAERSGSSIGALYNYFPDKQSIAFTLVNQYAQELEAHWKPMMEQAEILTHAEFADLFIERITQFAQERPAYPSLLAAPIRFRRDPAARKASRVAIAKCLSGEESVAFEGTVSTCCKCRWSQWVDATLSSDPYSMKTKAKSAD
jgi:AcrR family transcriptional regulator